MKAKEIAKLYSKGSRTGKISKEFLKHDIIEYAKRKCILKLLSQKQAQLLLFFLPFYLFLIVNSLSVIAK